MEELLDKYDVRMKNSDQLLKEEKVRVEHCKEVSERYLFLFFGRKIFYLGDVPEMNYSGDLKSGLVWILNGQREAGLQLVQILSGF